MLHRVTSLFASLFGCFSTICVKQHSAGKSTCRMAFALLLVPLFVFPSFAIETDVLLSPVTGYGYVSNTSGGTPVYEPFIEDWTVSHTIDLEAGQTFNFYNENIYERTQTVYCNYSVGNRMDVLFYLSGNDVQFVNAELMTPLIIFFKNANDFLGDLAAGNTYPRSPGVQFELWVDGEHIDTYITDSAYLPEGIFSYDGAVEEFVEIRAVCLGDNLVARLADAYPACTGLVQIGLLEYYVGNKSEYSDQFKVVFSKLDDINQNIQISNSYLVKIDNNVATITNNVTDIKNQFENSNSNIWNAFGEKVESLVVPSEQEMQIAIDGFNGKVKTKLGGLYDAYEIADNSINNFVSAFGVSTADSGYGFDFPGLSFPMNGTQITILPAQTVYIDNAAFTVFSNLLGNLVAFLCALAAFHISEDALICFLSGVSYWGFIRGRHDR